jgi:hypothetical protein
MKKLIFAVLVVLLALLAVTCDDAVLPAKLTTGALPAGKEGYMTITIAFDDLDRARAMSQTVNPAATAVDFYEVVFFRARDNAIVRDSRATSAAGNWTLQVPIANYHTDNTAGNSAIIFGGQAGATPTTDPNILIGIGKLTGDGDFTSTGGRTPDTSATFTMTYITSGVSTTYANSSFKITSDTTGTSLKTLASADGVTGPIPAFEIMKGEAPVPVTYTFNTLEKGLYVTGIGKVTSGMVTSPSPATTPVDVSSITVPSPAKITATSVDFSFNIIPDTDVGYSKISIEIPINLLSTEPGRGTSTTVSPAAWVLQGGLQNTTLDTGSNQGGAVLINVIPDLTPPIIINP